MPEEVVLPNGLIFRRGRWYRANATGSALSGHVIWSLTGESLAPEDALRLSDGNTAVISTYEQYAGECRLRVQEAEVALLAARAERRVADAAVRRVT